MKEIKFFDAAIFFFFEAWKLRIAKLRKDFHNEEKGEKNKSKSEFIFASFPRACLNFFYTHLILFVKIVG